MKLFIFLVAATCFQASAKRYSQTIALSLKNANIKSVFDEIEKQATVNFIYTTDLLQKAKPITINVSNEKLEKVLELCFQGQPITYTVSDQFIIVKQKEKS